MIGTGVFLKTRVMTCNVDSPGMVLAVWVAAGLLSLAGAFTYAELSTMMPRAGGEYVFIREAYGRRWAFLFGWTQFAIAKTASQAALAIGFAIFLNILSGGAFEDVYFTANLFGFTLPFGELQLVALATIAATTLLNCGAITLSGRVSTGLTVVKIGVVVAVGAGALLFADGSWSHLSLSAGAAGGGTCEGVSAAARGGMAGFGAAMLGALWAYDGWTNVAPLAGEVRDPERTLPRAFLGAMVVVGTLYLFVNLAYYYVLTPTEIASVPAASSVATEVARRFLGAGAVTLIAAALMISSVGALHSSILSGARFPFAMAQDRLFFRSLSAISPRTRVPVRALVAEGFWAGLLALSASYDTLTDSAIFALWIFYALAAGSVFVFRRRLPDAPRPYRTWGYPVVPIVFLGVTGWLIVNTLLTSPRQSLIGLALISIGLPVYAYWSRAKSTHEDMKT